MAKSKHRTTPYGQKLLLNALRAKYAFNKTFIKETSVVETFLWVLYIVYMYNIRGAWIFVCLSLRVLNTVEMSDSAWIYHIVFACGTHASYSTGYIRGLIPHYHYSDYSLTICRSSVYPDQPMPSLLQTSVFLQQHSRNKGLWVWTNHFRVLPKEQYCTPPPPARGLCPIVHQAPRCLVGTSTLSLLLWCDASDHLFQKLEEHW